MYKDSKKDKVIIVGGPTSTGKTNYAIKLAKELGGEIINADSRQVYKYLNIGTNKGNLTGENQKYFDDIPIHIIDFRDLDSRFSVFEWRNLAFNKIMNIQSRGKTPIIVGGTGLFIDSLVKNYSFRSEFKINNQQKNELSDLDVTKILEVQEYLKSNLNEVWQSLNYSDQHNPRRLSNVVRKLLEVDSGESTDSNFSPIADYTFYYPDFDWEGLKIRIDKRVESMFDEGLVNETKGILDRGYSKDSPGLQVMGYKEVIRYIEEEISLEKCKELVKIAHKQYARRQRTWFEGKGRGYKLILFSSNQNE